MSNPKVVSSQSNSSFDQSSSSHVEMQAEMSKIICRDNERADYLNYFAPPLLLGVVAGIFNKYYDSSAGVHNLLSSAQVGLYAIAAGMGVISTFKDKQLFKMMKDFSDKYTTNNDRRIEFKNALGENKKAKIKYGSVILGGTVVVGVTMNINMGAFTSSSLFTALSIGAIFLGARSLIKFSDKTENSREDAMLTIVEDVNDKRAKENLYPLSTPNTVSAATRKYR